MTRQRLSERKVKRLAEQTGLDVVAVLVRGNTGHRKDLCLADGSMVYLWPDGETEAAEGIAHAYKRKSCTQGDGR